MSLRAVNTTDYYLKDGKSKYGDNIFYKSLAGAIDIKANIDGDVVIHGWASTNDLDYGKDIVEPTAFASSLTEYMKNGIMMFMHDWYGKPIGKIIKADIKDNGLWVEGKILPTSDGKDISILIENGVLDAFSIGFSVKKETYDRENETRTIHDLKLWEISVVNAGMNPNALFTQAKSFNINLHINEPVDGTGKRKESKVDKNILDENTRSTLDNAEKMLSNHETAISAVSKQVEELKTNWESGQRLLKEYTDKADELKKGLITQQEFKTFCDKIGGDLLNLDKEIKTAQNAIKTIDKKIPFADFNSKYFTLTPLRLDDGNPAPEWRQKYYQIFEMPVKYEGEKGNILRMLRQLNDTVVITNTYMKSQAERNINPYTGVRGLKSYKLFKELLEYYDPDFAKAMYSTATGYGDEWVPTNMSAELYDLYEIEARVESLIPHFQMPTNPYDWPIKTSKSTLYRAAEASVNNPDELTKSRVGTDKVTFTAETFAIAIPVSPQLVEDSIIAIIPEITRDMSIQMANGYESMIINGDDTATHRDTQAGYTSVNPETYEDGLRYLAIDRGATFDTQSTSANVGDATTAFAAQDIRYTRKLTGVYGIKDTEGTYLTTISPFYYILNMAQFSQPGTYAAGNTWATGNIFRVDGRPLTVTANMVETIGAAGIYDSASTHKGILFFNETAFRIGEKRGITIETDKNIMTQQVRIVATMRKSFQTLAPSTLDPVAYGYNIE